MFIYKFRAMKEGKDIKMPKGFKIFLTTVVMPLVFSLSLLVKQRDRAVCSTEILCGQSTDTPVIDLSFQRIVRTCR